MRSHEMSWEGMQRHGYVLFNDWIPAFFDPDGWEAVLATRR